MMTETTETDVLHRLVPDLEADGYEVYLHPTKPLIPEFLGDFRPDAIALRHDKNLVVEVLRRSSRATQDLARIATLLQGREKWELRVLWVEPTREQDMLEIQDVDTIKARIGEVRLLAVGGHLGPALLLAWATFEALARLTLTERFRRPQTPGRLVDFLAGEGYLTPTEADTLRKLAGLRNRFVHGDLGVRVTKGELDEFATVLDMLLPERAH